MRREIDAIRSLQRFVAQVLPDFGDIRTELEEGRDPERPFALIEQASDAETTGPPAMQEVAIAMTATLYPAQGATRAAATDAALELRERMWVAVKWGTNPRRPTTDRLPLWCYTPRIEVHRVRVSAATGGTFTVTVAGAPTEPIEAAATAADVAAAVGAALVAGGRAATTADVVGQDRGAGLWDLRYVGTLAGERVGDPTIDGTQLLGAWADAAATTLLQGAAAPWRGPSDFMRVESFAQNTVYDPEDPTLVTVPVDLRLTFVRGLPLPLDLRILQRLQSDRR